MPEPSFEPGFVSTAGDVTLILGKRTTTKFKGFRVKAHSDVREAMRQLAAEMIEHLTARTPVDYSDDLAFDADEQYMLVRRDALVVHRPETRRGKRSTAAPTEPQIVEMDPAALEVLDTASSADQITRDNLKKQSFPFYAAIIGDDPARRIAFIKERNPYQVAQLGRVLTLFGDGLRRLDEPILAFAKDFDMVVTPGHIAIVRPESFEKLFRDIESLKQRIPVWSGNAVEALPLDAQSADLLRDVAVRSVRVASQLRGLQERGYLAKKYPVARLREKMIEIGLDHERLLQDDKLTLEESDVPVVLKLIDERLYMGWHSDTQWDVGTRARR
jgi:hypothetical protein